MNMTILCVDDDQDFAESISDLLEAHGYTVILAHDSARALDIAKKEKPVVALVDIRLGTESGLELLEHLHDQCPDIICVIITAFDTTNASLGALQQYAYDYLRKPVHPKILTKSMERCFERNHLKEQIEQLKKQCET